MGSFPEVDLIRVMVADDEPSVRDALANLISSDDGMELVGTASDAEEAIEVARRESPHVALVDVRMPSGGGSRAAREIKASSPATRVVALSAHEDRNTVIEMLRSGAVGYLVKGSTAEEITEAIRKSAGGESSLSSRLTGDIIRELVGQLELRDHEEGMRRKRMDLMRKVVEGEGLRMVLQPIVHLRTGTVVGMEALARFGAKPLRAPDRWFSEAESVGLRVDLDLAAARAALAQIEFVPADAYLSVNISPETAISPPFMVLLQQAPVDRVVFEISEHARVEDYEVLNKALDEIRTRGGRLAIDDAGAGFASLQHILRLSPDIIKLDINLTRGVDSDQAKRALATALTSFATEIGADMVAEGIETSDEVAALRTLGVSYGQGFFLGPPAPIGPRSPGAATA